MEENTETPMYVIGSGASRMFAKPYRCLEHGDQYTELVLTVSEDKEPHREHVYCVLCLDAAFLRLGLVPME